MEELSSAAVVASKQAWMLELWQQDIITIERILLFLAENKSLFNSPPSDQAKR